MAMTDEAVFHEGDRALYRLARTDIEVDVIEECDPIGFGAPRFVRIRVQMAFCEPYEVVVAERRLRPVTDAA
jgi:hypothetical protein